eukprot:832522-Prorocentrum_minimum.AAC.1
MHTYLSQEQQRQRFRPRRLEGGRRGVGGELEGGWRGWRGVGGVLEGIYRSSLYARKPQNPINSEEYQGHLQ